MDERALSFGAAASAYERFRLGYPDRLVDEVLAYAETPIRTALEIGAGTGKATRLFAATGIVVTATEPDPLMLAELRRHVPRTVATICSRFEDLLLSTTYDLVYAAASLHWTDPIGRWPRLAALLSDHGVFASFGGQLHLADLELGELVRRTRAPYLANDDLPSPDGTPEDSAMAWPGTELLASNLFTDVRQIPIERRAEMSAVDYIGHLSTISAYLLLPPEVRRHVFELILAVLPATVTLRADLGLHLARRTLA